jgi:LPS-assembly lipoprotein
LRAAAALASVLALSACGFHPLYATDAAGIGPGSQIASIYVEPIPERVGYQLRNALLDLFNAPGAPDSAAYRLKLTLHEMKQGVALRSDATITRYNYTLRAHYDLFATGATAPLKSGDVSALSAFNVASSPYATVVAERDANDRAATDIAERIRTELAVYFHSAAAQTGS